MSAIAAVATVRNRSRAVHRAFREFLLVPSLVTVGFVLLAAVVFLLDSGVVPVVGPFRSALQRALFGQPSATESLLGTVAGGTLTIASITFSIQLLAVQQAATLMTNAIYDQFLRRGLNQVYAGYFVGLAIYSLLLMAMVNPPENPIIGASLALLLTAGGLVLLILLVYTTVNQMRPEAVVRAIRDHTLVARQRQRAAIRRTRRRPSEEGEVVRPVTADDSGFLTAIDFDAIGKVARKIERTEVRLLVSIGAYIARGDRLAEVHARMRDDVGPLVKAVLAALRLESERDLDFDPAFGVDQLQTIAWTTTSSAKSNPSAAVLALHGLRDLLAHWADGVTNCCTGDDLVPVVYRDTVDEHLFNAFETVLVASNESQQSPVAAEILRGLAQTVERLTPELLDRAVGAISHACPALAGLILTQELDAACADLVEALRAAGAGAAAEQVAQVRATLRARWGRPDAAGRKQG